jgi:serine/threonine protein phosphatase 1
VHGRLDLLDALLGMIANDLNDNPPSSRPALIFLGDYIDRGPDSRGVVDRLLELSRGNQANVHCLKGNHEQVLLNFLEDRNIGPAWTFHGGSATLKSYGIQPPPLDAPLEDYAAIQTALREALDPSHLAFYKSLKLYFVQDDYAFMHAGFRWGTPLEKQTENDLLWIRADFLNAEERASHVIVHGHTPSDAIYLGFGRIGLDTGAYATGRLSAICLDGHSQRVLGTR